MKEVYTQPTRTIYIAIYRLVPLREVLRRELGGANTETIDLKKKLDKEVAECVITTSKVPESPKLFETEVFCF